VETAAAAKRLSLHYDVPAANAALAADPLRLRQIVTNLLTNAVKFTPEGGDVWLEIAIDRDEGRLALRVRDNGIGISDEDQQRLFQPFVQLDNSLSRSHSGTGLGLALVRRLAEAHGGDAVLESREGQGTTVTIRLPWRASELPVPSEPDSHPGSASEPLGEEAVRVLLAEDNEDIRESIEEYLKTLGCEVAVAENGAVAVAQASEWDPDVILMDVQMPIMDGLEATRRLRADPLTREIPIVAMTAMAQSGDAKRCLAAGANTYLSKPVRLKDLLATVRSYARS
jgi:CheY-like chemotaxis protein/anti-sigma regulatory factor (Ser/Thr protein kinase)